MILRACPDCGAVIAKKETAPVLAHRGGGWKQFESCCSISILHEFVNDFKI